MTNSIFKEEKYWILIQKNPNDVKGAGMNDFNWYD